MKLRIDRQLIRKLGFLLVLLIVAPFAIEILFLADLVGVELAVGFLFFFLRSNLDLLIFKWETFKRTTGEVLETLSGLVLFKPRNYLVHATASYLFIVVIGSTFAACVLWLPVLAMSSGFVT